MEVKTSDPLYRQQKTLKTLTLALIFSSALNIGLIATAIFSSWKESEISFVIPKAASKEGKKEESTNHQILRSFTALGYRELVSYLTNRTSVEEGYSKRDLALGALVAHHHFNLEKALGTAPEQKREIEIQFEETVDKFPLFPALNDEQFEAIIRFAYQEKWPLTAEGLFRIIKNQSGNRDPSLEQAFFTTPEFYAVQVLFQKTGASLPSELLLNLLSDGSWDPLNRFAREQAQMLDLSIEKRRRFLLSYLALHSPVAAQLLLVTDFSFAVKKLEDQGISDLLRLLTKTAEAERFCIELLRQPRTDTVWHSAAKRLYEFAGEPLPAELDIKAAINRFTGSNTPIAPSAAPKGEAPRLHVVKEGENLWKIARLYKASVDEIVKFNNLDKDRLYPGMTIKIPVRQGTGSEPPR